MQRRAERRFQGAAVSEKAELEQANALYSLLENRYSRKVRPREMGVGGV